MKRTLPTLVATLTLLGAQAGAPAADAERTVMETHFDKRSSSAVLTGGVKGDQYTDYRLRAGAGPTLKASLQPNDRASYFNLLQLDSDDAAMHIAQTGGNRFEGLPPADGG